MSVQTGRIAPLGPEGVPSGFVKQSRTDAVKVNLLNLDGDEQADLSVHGGFEKAVYGYAASHYPAWAAEFPELAPAFVGGAMGENLTISGLDEGMICVGDIHAIGSTLLQVCQPRQPCFKFALRHTNRRLPRAMVKAGRAGWYYRVVREGVVRAGDAVSLHDRLHPNFAFSRLVQIVYHGGATREELEQLATMNSLAGQWREAARLQLVNPERDE